MNIYAIALTKTLVVEVEARDKAHAYRLAEAEPDDGAWEVAEVSLELLSTIEG